MERKHCCIQMDMLIEEQHVPLEYIAKFREYKIIEMQYSHTISGYMVKKSTVHFGKTMKFCPWCGKEFLKPLFNEWKESLMLLPENINSIFPNYIERIPKCFTTDEWWIKKYSYK